MGLNIDYDDTLYNADMNVEEEDLEVEISEHQRDVRRKLEDRLERRRLKQELEDYEGELDDEFDWSDDL